MLGYTAVAEDERLKRVGTMWRRTGTVALATTICAIASHIAVAQGGPSPPARWWGSSGEAAGSALDLFGNVVHCSLGQCEQAAALGLDARLGGPFRVSVDARVHGFDYGASYGWRQVSIAASLGRGASTGTVFEMTTGTRPDTEPGIIDTVRQQTMHSATRRWSSAEARLSWREDRWWATALVGRVGIAQQGASTWGGLQFGADIGRGASLLLGVATTSRLLAAFGPESERHNVNFGLGFNTAILSSRPSAAAPGAGSRTAFTLSNAGPGRVRITIRVATARSLEFASDCTGWKPVAMSRTSDGWVIEVAATRGLHRGNIRIDGGRWIAPPSLATTDDEFAGEVGIFVVE
jgi:hypothetical protein